MDKEPNTKFGIRLSPGFIKKHIGANCHTRTNGVGNNAKGVSFTNALFGFLQFINLKMFII